MKTFYSFLWILVIFGFGEILMAQEAKPLVSVINYPYQIYAANSTKIHLCLFKPDFTPAVGAIVTVQGKEVGRTDLNGTLIFDYLPGENQQHLLIATYQENNQAYRTEKSFASNARTASFRSDQLFVYLDRGVYDPGSTVYIRCLAWELEGEYRTLKGKEIQLFLKDQKGKVYTGGTLHTNDFGIGAFSIPLPENMPEGSYELEVLYEQARETTRLQVRRFNPPSIRIEHTLKRYLTLNQKILEFEVSLSYTAGGQPKKSQLEVQVLNREQEILFTLPNVSADEKNPNHFVPKLTEANLEIIRGKLSEEAPFLIKLIAKDSFGRSDELKRDVVYTRKPFTAVLELDKDDYPQGEKVQLLAKIIDLDGKPVANLPLILKIEAWPLETKTQTDEKGVGTFHFPMGAGTASMLLYTPDVELPLSEKEILVNQPKPMTSKAETPNVKQSVQIVVDFHPDYIPIEKVVHVDFTDASGSLVQATTIPISQKEGKYIAEGLITSSTWGTMLANLYCCAIAKASLEQDKPLSVETVGFITEGQRVTFYPNREITLTIKDWKPKVRPGEIVPLDIQTDLKDREACLGVALVDEAVLSLLDPLEKTPADRFYNPQLKVLSTQGAGVLTWPVVDRNWGEPWRDIAYSDWGFKAPGNFLAPNTTEQNLGASSAMAEKKLKAPDDSPSPEPSSEKELKKEAGEMTFKGAVGDDDDEGKNDSFEASVGMKESESASSAAFADGSEKEKEDAVKHGTLRAPRPKAEKSKMPSITIRKNFPKTAFWEPLLITKDGHHQIILKIPDNITTQTLTVVASDQQGGLGLAQLDCLVNQEFSIQSAFPALVTLDDSLTVSAVVQNTTNSEQMCRVSLQSEGLELLSPKTIEGKVPAEEMHVFQWRIRAKNCGELTYTVIAESGDFVDSETKTLFVLPSGLPKITQFQQTLTKDQPWKQTVPVSGDSLYTVATVHISFPNLVPALQGIDSMVRYPHGCAEQVSSSILLNIAALEYFTQHAYPSAKIQEVRELLQAGSIRLMAMEHPEGGWGWFQRNEVNVYLTAYVLRALTELRNADFVVSEETLKRATHSILQHRNAEGLWNSQGIFFWETTNNATHLPLSAELFRILVSAYHQLNLPPEELLELIKLKDLMVAYLKKNPEEPLGVAHAMSGLLEYAEWKKEPELQKWVQSQFDFLVRLQKNGYWEPQWYHAYGGRVELNAVILELLTSFESDSKETLIRNCSAWLRSTQEAWGGWHNTIGTVAAVRALLKVTSSEQEIPCQVVVWVNGKEVAKVNIRPEDPYLTAVSLRHLEISRYLVSGENTLEVAYGGNLKAPAQLVLKQWTRQEQVVANNKLSVERTSSSQASLGDLVGVKLNLKAQELLPYVLITESIPSNSQVEIRSLNALLESKKIADYKVENQTLYLYLTQIQGELQLEYSMTPVLEGTASYARGTVEMMYQPTFKVSYAGTALKVE